jgi:hypothetical protein
MKKIQTKLSLSKATVSNLKLHDRTHQVKGGITRTCASDADPDCTATQAGCPTNVTQCGCGTNSWCYTCNPYDYTCQELCTSFHGQTC